MALCTYKNRAAMDQHWFKFCRRCEHLQNSKQLAICVGAFCGSDENATSFEYDIFKKDLRFDVLHFYWRSDWQTENLLHLANMP